MLEKIGHLKVEIFKIRNRIGNNTNLISHYKEYVGITLENSNNYLEVFYHEWRHYYQFIMSTYEYNTYNLIRYNRYVILFNKMLFIHFLQNK